MILRGFKFRPAGPVYHVPESLEKELAEKRGRNVYGEVISGRPHRKVWVGGIRRMEREGLLFESGDTPVILGQESLEWIDRDPAPDDSDMIVESEKEEDGTHFDVKIKTDGFTLEVERARIEWSKEIVKTYPIPR